MADFELNASVESLEGVPEPLHPFYRKGQDGKFNLIDPTSIDKLESTVKNVRNELSTAKERAKAVETWEKLGKTPEEIQELLQQHASEEERKAMEKGEFEKLKKQIEENHHKTVAEKEKAIERLRSSLENHLIGEKATQAIAEAKGVPTLLLPHVKSRVKVEENDDGEFHVVVLDTDGKTPKLNSKNEPMSIAELVESMKADPVFGRAFEGSGHSGGGGDGGSGGGGGGGNLRKSQMSLKEKTAYMNEHGHAAYAALPQ